MDGSVTNVVPGGGPEEDIDTSKLAFQNVRGELADYLNNPPQELELEDYIINSPEDQWKRRTRAFNVLLRARGRRVSCDELKAFMDSKLEKYVAGLNYSISIITSVINGLRSSNFHTISEDEQVSLMRQAFDTARYNDRGKLVLGIIF